MTFEEFFGQNQVKELPMQEVEIFTGVEPKYKCKNKLLQKLLTKLFGHVPVYEKRQAKVFVCKAEDYPRNFDGSLTIEVGE